MAAIDIGIGHDDDFVITEFLDVRFFAVFFTVNAESYTQSRDDVVHFIAFERFVPHGFFYIENFTPQRQYGLCGAAASLLGRPAGRISLDEEYFAFFGVSRRAVRQFSRQSASAHGTFALYRLPRFAGGDTCGSSENDFIYDEFGLFGVLFEIVGESFAHGLVHGAAYFIVAQFGLGLAFELGLGNFYRNDGDESFPEIFSRYFYFCLFECFGTCVFGIFFQDPRESRTETRLMRSSFDRVDVVHVRVQVFAVSRVVHDSAFDGNALFLGIEVDDVVDERFVVSVEKSDEFFDTFFGVEYFLFGIAFLVFFPEIGKSNGNAFIEISQFP